MTFIYKISKQDFSKSLTVVALSLVLAGCINQVNTSTSPGTTSTTTGEDSVISWTTLSPAVVDKNLISGFSPYAVQYCFQNNSDVCRRPAATESVVTNLAGAPVLIEAFQPAIGLANYKTVTVTKASVTMALLSINTATGKASFSRRHTRTVYGSGVCDPTAANAVGVPLPNEGEEGAITGIYLFDDGVYSKGKFSSAFLNSAKVWYSGLKPAASSGAEVFRFEYIPTTDFETQDFGYKTPYSDSGPLLDTTAHTVLSSETQGRLNLMGLDQGYVDSNGASEFYAADGSELWKEFVMIAYCIEGTKVLKANNQVVPLFLKSETTIQKPVMNPLSTTVTPSPTPTP